MTISTLRALGLATALLGSAISHGALARSSWTVDGPMAVPEVSVTAEAGRFDGMTADASPALTFLERSGATGGDGQHS